MIKPTAMFIILFSLTLNASAFRLEPNVMIPTCFLQKADTLIIEPFKKVPNDIEGCGSYFAYSKKDLDKMNYLLVTSYEGFGYIKVRGKLVRLKVVSSNRKNEEFYGSSIKETYQGGGFRVIVNTKEIRQQDGEVWYHKGTILIEKETKIIQRMNVTAATGC
ncbi:hypothetical protein EPD60_14020 [Flaviaesturariibacter flavus]|uniref:Uncharacterized protein n=1 Tax=Flaviaesturariibacter flavus TaxID=2502780 RepID=A0A4R1B927_9BACT|nr:hypothetical protein [Flaviaesturariibacter flavus]TCJ13019.1 hypothetical protein EPD60_14020 [Flaviaesturariibacter flavus]